MIQIHKALCFIWSYLLQRRFKTKERVSFFPVNIVDIYWKAMAVCVIPFHTSSSALMLNRSELRWRGGDILSFILLKPGGEI